MVTKHGTKGFGPVGISLYTMWSALATPLDSAEMVLHLLRLVTPSPLTLGSWAANSSLFLFFTWVSRSSITIWDLNVKKYISLGICQMLCNFVNSQMIELHSGASTELTGLCRGRLLR